MSTWCVSEVLASAPLPPPVQEGLVAAFPEHAMVLASNPSLTSSTWLVLYGSCSEVPVLTELLDRPLPLDLVELLADDLLAGRFEDEASSSLVEHHLATALVAYEDRPELEALAARLAGVAGPVLTQTLLASRVEVATKVVAARRSERSARIWWLTTPEAAVLADEVVWDLLVLGHGSGALPVSCAGAVSEVLYRRPALRARAASGPGDLLEAAARIPLDEVDQLALVEDASARTLTWELRSALRALADAPWCSVAARDRAALILGEELRPAPLGSGRDLRDLSWWELHRAVKVVSESVTPYGRCWPYVLLEVAKSPRLGRSARRRVCTLLARADWGCNLGTLALEALDALGAPVPERGRVPHGVHVPSLPSSLGFRLRTSSPRPGPPLDRALATPVGSLGSGELQAGFAALEPDVRTWETALVLLGDGFDGTLADVFAAARLLVPSR